MECGLEVLDDDGDTVAEISERTERWGGHGGAARLVNYMISTNSMHERYVHQFLIADVTAPPMTSPEEEDAAVASILEAMKNL